MKSYGPFVIAPTSIPQQIETDTIADKIVFLNGSPYTLIIDARDGKNPNKKIMPMDRDFITVGPQFNGSLFWTATQDLATAPQAPAFILYVETFGPHEQLPGTYPAPLPYLMSVGNQVQTSATVTQIINSGEGAPNDIIKDTPAEYNSPSVHVLNTGEAHFAPQGNGTQADALAVLPGDVSTPGHVEMDDGNFNTDGFGNIFTKDHFFKGGTAFMRVRNAGDGGIIFSVNGVDLYKLTNNGQVQFIAPQGGVDFPYLLFAPSDSGTTWLVKQTFSSNHWVLFSGSNERVRVQPGGGVQFTGFGGFFQGISRFSGTGSGTYSHGLGTTPNAVFITDSSAGGSMTVGAASFTSTTVVITCGAAHSFNAIALRIV